MNKIITISRQYGSGGRTIGRMVAEKLGIPCYDQEIITQIAEKSGFCEEYIREKGEYTNTGSNFFNAIGIGYLSGLSLQDRLWIEQEKVILELAEKGDCVIVGRCADFILQDKVECVKVFIHTSMKNRIDRILKYYNESEVPTEKSLEGKDKRRRAYYQYYTDVDWGIAKNYHLCLDSGELGVETCADIIANVYKSK